MNRDDNSRHTTQLNNIPDFDRRAQIFKHFRIAEYVHVSGIKTKHVLNVFLHWWPEFITSLHLSFIKFVVHAFGIRITYPLQYYKDRFINLHLNCLSNNFKNVPIMLPNNLQTCFKHLIEKLHVPDSTVATNQLLQHDFLQAHDPIHFR